jgi:hypothetical protein
MTTQNFSSVQSALAQIKGISFVSIVGYNSQLGETQNQLINVGCSLEKAKLDDLNWLMSINFSHKDIVLETARIELIKAFKISSYLKLYGTDFGQIASSVTRSLSDLDTVVDFTCTYKEVQTAYNRSKGQKDAYLVLDNGFKFNPETEEYYVFGFQVRDKVVTVQSEIEKADTRSALTKAKDSLKANMKSSKFRQFKISEINTLKAMGETIVVNE